MRFGEKFAAYLLGLETGMYQHAQQEADQPGKIKEIFRRLKN